MKLRTPRFRIRYVVSLKAFVIWLRIFLCIVIILGILSRTFSNLVRYLLALRDLSRLDSLVERIMAR